MEGIPRPTAGLEEECRQKIFEEYDRLGFLPSSQQLLLGGDPSFGLKRRMEVFRTTPHLRLALLAALPVNLVMGNPSRAGGRSLALDSRSRLAGDGNTFYFNGLILELLEMTREGRPPSRAEEAMEGAMAREFESDYLEYAQRGGAIKAWGYFPHRHHRFDPGKPLLSLLFKWGADDADLDSTSMVLCRLLKRGSRIADAAAILTLLEDHVHREGRFGKERLAYDNGVEAGDRGILLWVQEKHNELDAGVNLNLACLLAAMLEGLDQGGKARAFRLSSGIFRFLGDHIDRGSYSRKSFLMYYSLEAMAFLWMRLSRYSESMPQSDREDFDPRGDGARLGRHLAGLLEAEIRKGSPPFNAFDRLLVLPLLIRHGAEYPASWLSPGSLRASIAEASARPFEFGKFVYPMKLIYGCRSVGLCAALAVLREAARSGIPWETAGAFGNR